MVRYLAFFELIDGVAQIVKFSIKAGLAVLTILLLTLGGLYRN